MKNYYKQLESIKQQSYKLARREAKILENLLKEGEPLLKETLSNCHFTCNGQDEIYTHFTIFSFSREHIGSAEIENKTNRLQIHLNHV